jgi:hypothetical protein
MQPTGLVIEAAAGPLTPAGPKLGGQCVSCKRSKPAQPQWTGKQPQCTACPYSTPVYIEVGNSCTECLDPSMPLWNPDAGAGGACESCPDDRSVSGTSQKSLLFSELSHHCLTSIVCLIATDFDSLCCSSPCHSAAYGITVTVTISVQHHGMVCSLTIPAGPLGGHSWLLQTGIVRFASLHLAAVG